MIWTRLSTIRRMEAASPDPMSIILPSISGAVAAAMNASTTSFTKTQSNRARSGSKLRAPAGEEGSDDVGNEFSSGRA